jgi:NADPH:quinone reductase-like Zn-dependent oxidoreductase
MKAVYFYEHGGPEVLTYGGLETVLVVGAGGGVNTAAIQIAKLAGATVYVVVSTDEKLEGGNVFGKLVLKP